ncbi:Signal transduction histidine-protein kinase/phosphatase DegS [Roseovarius sp. THAF9]|uniref:cache domain-containing protein n=1 Tax=Roseovarius sp. THAF9 TaxID=2587847 RepID=UPI001267D29C|nr:cache domain-containing protein [Roseovarius sp. THAF9]QFT93136.1 Signal transduction histidine-protein kinase/phosphatase DegS [Roseovarius sp. THAF9]
MIRPHLNYGQKLFLTATLPLILAMVTISVLVTLQSRQMAEREIHSLEEKLIAAKRDELKNYLSLARTAIINIYGRAAPDDETAKLEVTQILSAMIYGQDGYFFVFDYDGNNLVSPRHTQLIGRNWSGMQDESGVPITDELIRIARTGGGYHSYQWTKPSTGEKAQIVTYVVGLQDWRWAIGTGVFIDDVIATVNSARATVEQRVQRTFLYIGGLTMGALLLVFTSGLFVNIRERRVADAKLKKLTQRVFDAQEEERGRVARELHDGISQILVGVRYALDSARRRFETGDARAGETLDRGILNLSAAIQEVRRISRDLRPGVLDDLGVGPALKSLVEDFGARTGIKTEFRTVPFRNRLDDDAKTALYRVAQEALTNIERHADATCVSVDVRGHKSGATLRISDNGRGLDLGRSLAMNSQGLGLRNMQERIEQLDGTLRILSSKSGTVIEADVPLTHMLQPEDGSGSGKETKASA